MCEALVLHGLQGEKRASEITAMLGRRQVPTSSAVFGSRGDGVERWSAIRKPAVVALVPSADSPDGVVAAATLRALADAGAAVIVIADGPSLDPAVIASASIVVTTRTHPDLVQEAVIRHVLGPFPDSVELRVRPSSMPFVSGVGAWGDAVLAADSEAGTVVKIERDRTTTVRNGLTDPQHLAVDRSLVAVVDKGLDLVQLHVLREGGLVTPSLIRSINGKPLRAPTGVAVMRGRIVVCDTDTHRVAMIERRRLKRSANADMRGRWLEFEPTLPFEFPCGAAIDDIGTWVADTLADRVVVFDAVGAEILRFKVPNSPVGLARWHDMLIVTTDSGVVVFRIVRSFGGRLAAEELGPIAPEVMRGSMFGVSVNAANVAVVSDRTRQCVWTVDLPRWLALAVPR